jgi:hypothetical protein
VQLLEVLAAKPLKLEYDAFAKVHMDFFINDNLNNINQQLFRWGTNNRSNECEIRTHPSG